MMNNRYMLLSAITCVFISLTHAGTLQASSIDLASSGEEERTLRILSIDSGGIRGVIPLVILNRIEHELNRIFDRSKGEKIRIADCFDVIAGVSTGGFIALGLTLPDENGRPQYSAKEVVKLYDTWKQSFPKRKLLSFFVRGYMADKPQFNAKIMDESLAAIFGDQKQLSEASDLADVIIPVFDLVNDDLYYFDSWKAKTSSFHDYLVKDAARAAVSVVGYLPAQEIKDREGHPHTYVDGIVIENPSVDAYTIAKSRYPDKDKLFIVSLGTGSVTRKSLAELGVKGIRSLTTAGQIVVGDASSKRSKKQLERIVEYEENLDYYRIQTQLHEENYGYDNTKDSNFRALKARALDSASQPEVQKIIEDLVQYLQQEKGYTFKRGGFINPVKFAKTVLDLSHRKVKDKHLQQIFSDIAENEAIEFINLRHNEIGCNENKGLRSIVKFLNQNPSREIEVLDLSHNWITDDHIGYLVTHLNPNVRVRQLKLNHTKVTATGLQRLGEFVHYETPHKKYLTVAAKYNRLSRQEHEDLSLNKKLKIDSGEKKKRAKKSPHTSSKKSGSKKHSNTDKAKKERKEKRKQAKED